MVQKTNVKTLRAPFAPRTLYYISIRNLQFLNMAPDIDLKVLQPAHFFDYSFLKVSVDQFSLNMYIPIRNPQGGGADISSFAGEKSLGSEANFREIWTKSKIKI